MLYFQQPVKIQGPYPNNHLSHHSGSSSSHVGHVNHSGHANGRVKRSTLEHDQDSTAGLSHQSQPPPLPPHKGISHMQFPSAPSPSTVTPTKKQHQQLHQEPAR